MARIFPGWKVVIGAGTGIAFGSAVFIGSSFAILSAAIGQQFGMSQPELALGASIVLFMQIFTYPAAGLLADRIGSRRAAMVSITGFAGALLFLSQIGSFVSPYIDTPRLQFYAAFFLIGLLGAGTNVVSYTRALTNWFVRRRGLALGLAAAFQAVGATVLPLVMHAVIARWDWQTAVLSLAAFLLVVCLPLVARFVKDSPAPFGLQPDGDQERGGWAPATAPVRLRLGAVLSDSNFVKLALAFAIMGLASYALSTNIVFILTETSDLTVEQVAVIQGITGASVLIGRVGFGYLLDHFSPPGVALASILLSALVFVSYGHGGTMETLMLTAVVAGTSIGGESDLMPYLAGRYFGTAAVSTVFGWFLSAFVIGAAIGPIAFAEASVALAGPAIPLYIIAGLQIIPAILFLTLDRRPENRPAAGPG